MNVAQVELALALLSEHGEQGPIGIAFGAMSTHSGMAVELIAGVGGLSRQQRVIASGSTLLDCIESALKYVRDSRSAGLADASDSLLRSWLEFQHLEATLRELGVGK